MFVENSESGEEILNTISSGVDLLASLDALNEHIRCNQKFREKTPDLFYSVFHKLIENFLCNIANNHNYNEIEVFEKSLKCLRNSAAAFKTTFTDTEKNICLLLNKHLNENVFELQMLNLDSKAKLISHDSTLLTFKYFFNLSQGNSLASEIFCSDWLSLSMKALHSSSFDLSEMASMLIVNRFVNSTSNQQQQHLVSHLKSFTVEKIFELLNKLLLKLDEARNEEEDDDENDEFCLPQGNFSFKLIEYLFEYLFFSRLLNNEWHREVCLETRLNMFRILKIQLSKNEQLNKLNFLESRVLSSLMNVLESSALNFFTLLDEDKINQDNFHLINDYLLEVKLLSSCLSDLLTVEETQASRDFLVSNLAASQENQTLFKCVCETFRVINENEALRNLYEKNKLELGWKRNGFKNLKREMVRLLGVLVYGNYPNQRLLVEYKVLHLLANSLKLDMENLLVREWSIVALKHVLAALDNAK